MITKWWKNLIKTALQTAFQNPSYGYNIPLKGTNGTTYYATGIGNITIAWSNPMTFNAQSAGVSVGTSDTPATDEDYILGSTITSGLSATCTTVKTEEDGIPCTTLNMVLSNSTNADIIVKEVGLKCSVTAVNSVGGTSTGSRTILVDRTVLDTPVTVPARGNAAVFYKLKTDYNF